MTTTKAIRVQQGNAETVDLVFTEADQRDPVTNLPLRFNLTGQTLEFYVKASKEALDSAPMFKYTSGAEITVTTALQGEATAQFAAADLDVAGEFWYHCDAVNGTIRKTAGKGPFIVEPV
jgi:hypothetical protein